MTNLLSFPYDFDNAAWGKQFTTVSANIAASPNGDITADAEIENATDNVHEIFQIPSSLSNSTRYTFSVYAKEPPSNSVRYIATFIYDGNTSFDLGVANFDLNAGSVTSFVDMTGSPATTASIVAAPNGWYQCIVSITTGTVDPPNMGVAVILNRPNTALTTLPALSYVGDNVSNIYLWGAQMEQGSTATSLVVVTPPMRGLCLSNFGYRSSMIAT